MLTPEQLTQIELYGGYFFSPEEVAIIVGVDKDCQTSNEFKNAYRKGKLIQEAAIRKSVCELAIAGSSPAQMAALKFIEQSKLDD